MGNWNVSIQGMGAHHNHDNPTDADRMAKTFVDLLRKAGHSIESASFTHGGKVDLTLEPNPADPYAPTLAADPVTDSGATNEPSPPPTT